MRVFETSLAAITFRSLRSFVLQFPVVVFHNDIKTLTCIWLAVTTAQIGFNQDITNIIYYQNNVQLLALLLLILIFRQPFKTKRLSENWTKRIELFSEIRKISLLDGVQKMLEKLELIGIAKRILKFDFHNFSVNGLQ